MRSLALVLAFAAVACADDARVLYAGSEGGQGGVVMSTAIGTGGMVVQPPGSAGAERPPPPPPPSYCFEERMPDPCVCEPEVECVCGGPEPIPQMGCLMDCPMGGCPMVCGEGMTCDMTCPFGCAVRFEPHSFGTLAGCDEGCSLWCREGAYCSVWSTGPTLVYCDAGAICECPQQNCACMGPGCTF